MSTNIIKSPLLINIFWQESFEEMKDIEDKLYGFFLRNVDNPLDRYLGIAVKLYPFIPELEDLQLKSHHRSINIFMVDDEMNTTVDWETFANELSTYLITLGTQNHRLIPVAVTEASYKFSIPLSTSNFISYYSQTIEYKQQFILLMLAQEVCRLLYETPQPMPQRRSVPSLPLTLFLSHAKRDGAAMAERLREHINSIPNLDTFFDAQNIPGGSSFPEEIEAYVERSIILIIQTDEFASREWCRKEALFAKKHNRPLIVVNQYEKGEKRSFPYIGNVPHIHIPNDLKLADEEALNIIILEALREAIKVKYHTLKNECLATALGQSISSILSYPPELISLVHLKDRKEEVLIYPDPPIGREELVLLNTLRPDLTFTTPALLPLLSATGKMNRLKDLKVAISLSDETNQVIGFQDRYIQDLMVELARYLLVGGSQLIYSGNINYPVTSDQGEVSSAKKFNFAQLFIELIETYRYDYQDQNLIKAVSNYSAYPLYTQLSTKDRARLKRIVNFIPISPPDNLKIPNQGEKALQVATSILGGNTFRDRYVWSKSLSAMRTEMIQNCDALIVLGGKKWKFRGKMPGVLEETLLALESQKPIYVIGAFGGVASTIIEALQGEQPDNWMSQDFKQHAPTYLPFMEDFNQHPLTIEEERIDYTRITTLFNQYGQSNASPYDLHNGLSKEENESLFRSHSEIEIISLILKGLKTINTLS